MNTIILTEEQTNFLLDILSHDGDMIAQLIDGANAEHFASTPSLVGEYAAAVSEALLGEGVRIVNDAAVDDIHAFHGTRETGAGDFVIDTDRSLDEGPNVLTARCLNPEAAFMGWIGGGAFAKFVEVPTRLAAALADCIDFATDDENAADNLGIDLNDMDDVEEFTAALRRCAPLPTAVKVEADPALVPAPTVAVPGDPGWLEPGQKRWDIVNPDGSVEATYVGYDEIEALDLWSESQEMGSYTGALQQHVLDGHGPEFSLPVYRHEGVIYAIHSNYEVRVVEHGSTRVDVAETGNPEREAQGAKAVWAFMDDHYPGAVAQAAEGIDTGDYDVAATDLMVNVLHSLMSAEHAGLTLQQVEEIHAQVWRHFVAERS